MVHYIRAMIDANVYSLLFEGDLDRLEKLIASGILVIYGCNVVRQELREIPPELRVQGRNYRNALLQIYDDLVGGRSYQLGSVAEALAEEYWAEYAGGILQRKIIPDFIIVALSSLHGLGIVVSNNARTMKSGSALAAYSKVNERNSLKTPVFASLEGLFKLQFLP